MRRSPGIESAASNPIVDELTEKTAKNSLFSLVAFIWPVLLAFFVTPIIVHLLGVEKYGIYALVTSFVGFFGFLDFGVSPSLVKYVAEHYARNNFDAIQRLFSTAVFFYLCAGTVAAVLIAIFARFFAVSILKVSPPNHILLQAVLYIVAVGFLVNMVLTAFSALPGALQRFDLTSKLNLTVTTVSSLLTVLILFVGGGLIGVMILAVITSLAAILVYSAINHRLLPKLRFHPYIDKPSLKIMLTFGSYATIGSVASIVLFQLDKIILGSIAGAAAVTYYVLPGNIAIKVYSSIVALTTVVFPLSSDLFSSGNLDRLRNLYLRATRIVLTLLALFVTPMYFFAGKFLHYWVGITFADKSTLVFQLLLATYSILGLTAIPFFMLYGSGKPKVAMIFSVISGVLNVVLLFLLIPRYGINGAAWAYLLAVIPAIGFMRWVEKYIVGAPVKKFYLELGSRLLVLIVISAIFSLIALPYITSLKLFVLSYFAIVLASGGLFVAFRMVHPQDTALIREFRKKLPV